MRHLPQTELHLDLWYAWLDQTDDAALCDQYAALLTDDERARRRFVFDKDRHQFLVARALCRCALSHYTGIDPADWRFEQTVYGKPSIAEPAGVALSFNVSHSSGLVACVVAPEGRIGLDVECLDRKMSGLPVARRYFADEEVAVLESTPAARQHAQFFRFWTLKESYIKAHGRGLSIPLRSFAFHRQTQQPWRLAYHDADGEDPLDWQFATLDLSDRYPVALAVDAGDQEALNIAVRHVVPLRGAGDCRRLPPAAARHWALS